MKYLVYLPIVLLIGCSKDHQITIHGDPGGIPAPGCTQFDDDLDNCFRCVEMVLRMNYFKPPGISRKLSDTVKNYVECQGTSTHGSAWQEGNVVVEGNEKVFYLHYINCYTTIYDNPYNDPRLCGGNSNIWTNIPTGYRRCVRTAQSSSTGEIDASDALVWGDGWKEVSHEQAIVGDSIVRWFCYDKIP